MTRLQEAPEPDRAATVLQFHLHEEDYVRFVRVLRRRQVRRTAPSWVLMGLLVGALLLASTEPWQGGFALLPEVIGILTVVAAFVLLAWRLQFWRLRRAPGRLPPGEVVLAVGAAGGWVRSTQGVRRFGWRAVREVYSDADQVLLLFSSMRALVVPTRAVPGEEHDALVADIEAWREAADQPLTRSTALVLRTGPTDPFDPPSS